MPSESPSETVALSLLSATLEPLSPSDAVRRRLLDAAEGPARFLPFAKKLATAFDLPLDEARGLLRRAVSAEGWTRGVWPIEGFFHFRPGASLAPLRGGFVRLLPGAGFPLHRHADREVTLVLAGAMRDGGGKVFGAGEAIEMLEGSTHSLHACGDESVVLALLHGRIEMLGE